MIVGINLIPKRRKWDRRVGLEVVHPPFSFPDWGKVFYDFSFVCFEEWWSANRPIQSYIAEHMHDAVRYMAMQYFEESPEHFSARRLNIVDQAKGDRLFQSTLNEAVFARKAR